MLAKRLPTILPEMSAAEALEVTRIHSVMGLVKSPKGIVATRPFRAPHHTASDIALVGGGPNPRPGEITLSHNGVLFLDELPEFNRNVLEALRQPLEDHTVTVSRACRSQQFPAQFMLVAAMNPCPCGWLTDPKKSCHCGSHQIQNYLNKISGPLMDRIDLHLEVPALKTGELFNRVPAETSADIKKRTTEARERQLARLDSTGVATNAAMGPAQVKKFCSISDEGTALLRKAVEELGLSARAHDKILKVSRTISDLEGCDSIEPHHLAEAIQYRALDRNWF